MSLLYMYLTSLILLSYTIRCNKDLLRIRWKSLLFWFGFVIVNMAVKYFTIRIPAVQEIVNFRVFARFDWLDMVVAGYEEVLFTLPAYYVLIKTKGFVRFLSLTAIAMLFSFGHSYQGFLGMIPTFLYMRFIAPKFMCKYGLTNMIVGHIIYDMSILILIKTI